MSHATDSNAVMSDMQNR